MEVRDMLKIACKDHMSRSIRSYLKGGLPPKLLSLIDSMDIPDSDREPFKLYMCGNIKYDCGKNKSWWGTLIKSVSARVIESTGTRVHFYNPFDRLSYVNRADIEYIYNHDKENVMFTDCRLIIYHINKTIL